MEELVAYQNFLEAKVAQLEQDQATAAEESLKRAEQSDRDHREQVRLLDASRDEEMKEMQRLHSTEISKLAAKHEKAVIEAVEKTSSTSAAEMKVKMEALESVHAAALAGAQAASEEQIRENTRKARDETVERLSHQHELALIDYTKRQQSVLSAHMQERERLYTDLAAQHQRARIIMVWHHGWFSTT